MTVLTGIITHLDAARVRRQLAYLHGVAPESRFVVCHGGTRHDFEELDPAEAVHAEEPSLRGPNREQSYTEVLRAVYERFVRDEPEIDLVYFIEYDHLVYTGPIDAFFDYRYGALPYRSLEFELRNEPTPDGSYLLPAASINEPSEEVPHTRVTEFRRMAAQETHPSSTVAYEYPRSEGDPYYPIPRDDTRALFKRYEALAAELPDVTFVGRLARYQYLNMDQVVGQALSAFEKLDSRLAVST